MKPSMLVDQHLFTAKQLLGCCIENYLPLKATLNENSVEVVNQTLGDNGHVNEISHEDDFIAERRALVLSVVCHLSLAVRFALEEFGADLTDMNSSESFISWLDRTFSDHSKLGFCLDQLSKRLDSGKITHSSLIAFMAIRRDKQSWLALLESLSASTRVSVKDWEIKQANKDLPIIPIGRQEIKGNDKINLIASSTNSGTEGAGTGRTGRLELHWASFEVPPLLVLCRELQQCLARMRTDNSEF